MDSVKCEDYFRCINNDLLITRWSRAPILKESNDSIICKLCEILLNNTYEKVIATLIIDENGIPVCVKTIPKIDNDSLRTIVKEMLYAIKFKPAKRYEEPVISYYPIIFNGQRCGMYMANTNKRVKYKK
ncbi:hypothetical protein [Dysgonomonas termitidis]|uniref:TonB C-terminal domain-containing protein n=1 Tax=Dysgonomonas termitidis TaxID=1516126 RepID=A0ABV9KYX2_9BACT